MISWKTASILTLATLASCSSDEAPYFIPGSATLPTCTEPPAFDLTGGWSDNPGSIVSIRTTGCDDAQAGTQLESCPLGWRMTQTGGDVEILVDDPPEYRILGRLCGAELHLEGGWWLPVEDAGECTYEEDSAAEVGIQMGGSTLMVSERDGSLVATGVLDLRGPCEATYDVELFKFE